MRQVALDVHQTFCEVAIREGGKTYSAGRVATAGDEIMKVATAQSGEGRL
jgi:hypothetical protein